MIVIPPALTISGRTPKRLSGQLARAAFAIIFAVSLATLAGLKWTTQSSDAVSVERQVRVARHSLEIALDELALQQETVAIWDNSALEMTRDKPNQQWLFDNVGFWLHRIFRHDETFLIDSRLRPVQVVTDGRRRSVSRFDALQRDLTPLIRNLRRRQRDPGLHDRVAGSRLPSGSSVQTTARPTHETHLMLVGGRPAAASAMLIQPSTENFVQPRGAWPMLVSVRYLDGSFMKELESRYLLDGARFSLTPEHRPTEQSLELKTDWGEPLGYLVWTPELPGTRISATLVPVAVLLLSVLGLLTLVLVSRLRESLNERAAFEARAAHLAYHDSLTGLPNRALLSERMQAYVLGSHKWALALLLVDLDRFKQVNDTLGHLAGDQLIREFAARLRRIVRPGDTVARLGGDEFAVLLCDGWERREVEGLCDDIIALFRVPFELFETQVFGGASIGAVYSTETITDPTELMRRADVALYRAKADGRGCARVFEDGMDESGKARARLESDLRDALRVDQFAAFFQPQVGRGYDVVGQELLLRWRHPRLGCISPQEIIPLAEETGLILPIGDWMLREAAGIAAANGDLFTAVNLSPVQLREAGFAEHLAGIFAAAGARPDRVELEVTEQVLLDESSPAAANLQRLRQQGFRIALDDFGTGYSSLSYLRQLAVDKIKIDRSFVADLQHSRDARAIVAAIVTLGRALGLTVAAEGVETRAQAEILIAAGCDQLQGFLFGEPRPVDLELLATEA